MRSRNIRGGTDKGWGWYLDGKREEEDQQLLTISRPAPAHLSRRTTPALNESSRMAAAPAAC